MIKQNIVVEGKNDTKRLKSFFDVETIETHGMGLGKQTVELIRAAGLDLQGVHGGYASGTSASDSGGK